MTLSIYWIYISVFLTSALVALSLTPLIKFVALRFNCLDAPSARKVHQQPMVRLGGIAIFVATLAALVLPWLGLTLCGPKTGFSAEALSTAVLLLLGGSGFFLIGLADDLFDLSPLNRLWMQGAIASLLWCFGLRIDTLMLPGLDTAITLQWLSLPATVLWLAGVVNAINWIDGLDGLAAGTSSIAVTTLVILSMTTGQPVPAIIGTALLGSLLGFLRYNYNPAKIFMGDGGSYFVGYMLASLCLVSPYRLDSAFSTLLPLVILAVPLADMTTVILARLCHRCSPFSADKRHLHHRLLNKNFSHKTIVWIMYALTLLAGSFALLLVGLAHKLVIFLGLSVSSTIVLWQLCRLVLISHLTDDTMLSQNLKYSKEF